MNGGHLVIKFFVAFKTCPSNKTKQLNFFFFFLICHQSEENKSELVNIGISRPESTWHVKSLIYAFLIKMTNQKWDSVFDLQGFSLKLNSRFILRVFF